MLLRLSTHRRHLVVLILSLGFFSIVSLLLFTSSRHSLNLHPFKAPPPANEETKKPPPEFYDWDTRSSFRPTKQNVTGKSIEEICSAFPSHLLDSIQPVLRTGHGVLDKRIRPQLASTSACLSNLLIFSDISEQFDGHDIIDVIADTATFNPLAVQTHEQLAPYRSLIAAVANGSEKDIKDAGREAWGIDKFKFLPSISRAWRMRPERRWYIFFEGDTLIVWDNLFRLLENFDPDVPLYFGSPSPGHDGMWFAHGGEGYVISREAMRRLTSNDFSSETGEYLGSMLAKEHWDTILRDCCGDSVLGWALWQRNISISGLFPMFNPHPPHGVPFSDQYWCQPIIGVHKPHRDDMKSLWHWEAEHREVQRPLLYRDLALTYLNMTEHTTRSDWDNADFDGYPAEPESGHASIEACAAGCEAHGLCFQWTYHLRRCTFVRAFRLGVAKKALGPVHENGTEITKEMGKWTTEEKTFRAGWQTGKIKKWVDERPCEKALWVTPSIKRIF